MDLDFTGYDVNMVKFDTNKFQEMFIFQTNEITQIIIINLN